MPVPIKNTMMHIRISSEELEAIHKFCDKKNVKVGAFVRDTLAGIVEHKTVFIDNGRVIPAEPIKIEFVPKVKKSKK